jgi:uncharacterized protein (TIGR03435 family)
MTANRSLAVAAQKAALAIALLTAGSAFSQSLPQFEAAAVKPSPPGIYGKPFGILIGAQFTAKTATLRALMAQAWGLQPTEIQGGPGWLDSDHFDITAKPDLSNGTPTKEQLALMLRGLLVERFHLSVHEATKDMAVYQLVAAKDGAKLKPAENVGAGTQTKQVARGLIGGKGMPMQYLTDTLTSVLGRPVKDQTGLAGNYDFRLQWMPDETEHLLGAPAPAGAEMSGPSLFQALQDQLGLRLQATKAPTRIVVVDKVERLQEN